MAGARVGGGLSGGQPDGDPGPLTRAAREYQASAEELREPPGVGQTEAGSGTPALVRAAHLVELLEDLLLLLLGDADSRVRHREDHVVAPGSVLGLDLQAHGAVLGELERVGQEVAQDAGEHHLVGDEREAGCGDRQLHLAPRAVSLERSAQLAEYGPQVDLRHVRFEAARFGLGDVQEFVDEREQRGSGGGDQGDLSALFLVEPVGAGVVQEPGEAHNGVDRRPQFMADVRPEPGLGLAGLPQLARLLVQFRVEGDDPSVGLLQLLGQLGIEGYHSPVGLLQLLVETAELLLLLPRLLERGDQIAGLGAGVLEDAAAVALDEEVPCPAHALGGLRARRELLLDQQRPATVLVVHLDQAGGGPQRLGAGAGAVPPVERRAQHGLCALFRAQGDPQFGRAEQITAQLAQGGRQAYLVLSLRAQGLGGRLAAAAEGEDVLLRGDADRDEVEGAVGRGRSHQLPFSTATPASSLRMPASRSSCAAATSGVCDRKPGRAAGCQRSVSPSECMTTPPWRGSS